MKKVVLSWSSGKDCTWALYQLQQDPTIEVVGLCCTINEVKQRVAMHGVRVELLKEQAKSLNLPIDIIALPFPCSNEQYQSIMSGYIDELKNRKVDAMAFGDLFLTDVRNYRETMLADTGIEPIFPIWGLDTNTLPDEMFNAGVKTVITCIDGKKLDINKVGVEFNSSFISSLPEGIDPCGENGEFHSFVFDAPNFSYPLNITVGEIVDRDGFFFADFTLSE